MKFHILDVVEKVVQEDVEEHWSGYGSLQDTSPNSLPATIHNDARNRLTPHPRKTELMLLSRKQFIGPRQAILLGDHLINEVLSTRSLDVEMDNQRKWDKHLNVLIESYSQKLYLLKSIEILYFLPGQARIEFYFKFILPSGILIWGSCGKTKIIAC